MPPAPGTTLVSMVQPLAVSEPVVETLLNVSSELSKVTNSSAETMSLVTFVMDTGRLAD